jgi:cysteine synthase A
MHVASDLATAVGNTPLIKLRAASEATGCDIYGKAEFMNPGQSVKDRAALFIIKDAIARGTLKPGGTIVEGTAGNTGIGLALVATELARSTNEGVIWANQFDNVANRQAHIETTGPEIWAQTDGKVDGFCCAVGSGGTLAGIAMALQPKGVKIALADPDGAALHSYYTTGELASDGGSIAEGIGQVRITKNLEGLKPDFSYNIPDTEALPIVFDMLQNEGLCLGASSGVNIAGAMRLAREMEPGHTIVTILCDFGTRYQTKLYNPTFLREKNLPVPDWLDKEAAVIPSVFEDV